MHSDSPHTASAQWPINTSWIPFTSSFRTRHKLSASPRVPLLYLLSGLVLFLVVLSQLLGSRKVPQTPSSFAEVRRIYSPFGDSVYKQEAYYDQLEPGTQCKPKNLFSADLPISFDISDMALGQEAKRVAALFEYGAEDLNKGVKAFLKAVDDGLEKQDQEMPQIPTYVTNVPNGTEKVSQCTAKLWIN